MTSYLGIDLAWSTRNRTGVAALDDDGVLVASASVRTDDEIDAFVNAWSRDAVVAAIDAPLIVLNETGQRVCERLVNAEFGPYYAGAHSSNRSNALFREPRGLVLAERHGWDVDPATVPGGERSVAIEVYPHPAMITLFALPTVLRYKRKPGRTVESCRDELLRLIDLMEQHTDGVLRLTTSSRWAEIRTAVLGAHRPMHLAAVEDEVDAIFCAYLARLWGRRDERMRVLGDVHDGYIVVPGHPRVPPERPTRGVSGPQPCSLLGPGAGSSLPDVDLLSARTSRTGGANGSSSGHHAGGAVVGQDAVAVERATCACALLHIVGRVWPLLSATFAGESGCRRTTDPDSSGR